MRLPRESLILVKGDAIGNNTVRTYSTLFPLGGEGWFKLRLIFKHTVVHVDGAVPIVLGEYGVIKNIVLKTSKNEIICSTPGHSMYYLNWVLNNTEPIHTPAAAVTAVYTATVDIPFSSPLLARKEDLCIDSGQYSNIELQITMGGIADFLGTPGDDTLVSTLTICLVRSKSMWEETGKPVAIPYMKHYTPFDPSARAYIDIESAQDLTLFGLIMMAQSGATVVAGVPYTGVPIDCLDDLTFRDNVMRYLDTLPYYFFWEERKIYSDFDITGMYPYLFVQEGSYRNAYWTGGKSEVKFEIGSVIGAPSTPQCDMLIYGMREQRQ